MPNEWVLVLSLLFSFGGLLLFFRYGGRAGIYAWNIFVTITANIEVMVLIHAFGMDQTLGNTLFAASFVTTDILSEEYGKKASARAVKLGVLADIAFFALAILWQLYTPSEADTAMPLMKELFAQTPRVMAASLLAYVVSQAHDVWSYHFWWHVTGDNDRFMWVRNNCSTLVSQLINTVIFTFAAFWGTYDFPTLLSILLASYVIFIFTSLLDTPFVYIARWMYRHTNIKEIDQD